MFSKLRLIRKEEGQAVVEAALVIPLLILVLCGILDFGWIFAHQIMLNNSSRDAARFAVVNYADDNLQILVEDRIQQMDGMGGGDDLVVTVTKQGEGDIKVEINRSLRVLTPLAGIFVSDQMIDLNAITIMWAG